MEPVYFSSRNQQKRFRLFIFLSLLLLSILLIFTQTKGLFFFFNTGTLSSSGGYYDGADLSLVPNRFQRELPKNLIEQGLFKPNDWEAHVCSSAKQTGRCSFEERHLPPILPWHDNATNHLNINRFKQLSQRIALVVTFNKASNYIVLPFIESFYRGAFVKIIFCGPSTSKSTLARSLQTLYKPETIDEMQNLFISYQPDVPDFGENVYTCLNIAINEKFGDLIAHDRLDGVFVMADDVVFNYWNLFWHNLQNDDRLDLEKSYVMPAEIIYDTRNLHACHTSNAEPCNMPNPWPNWPKMFQPETQMFYEVTHYPP